MILKIQCVWGSNLNEECYKIISISDEHSLFDLHLFIQEEFEFGNDHLFKFFAGRNARNQKINFSNESDWDDQVEDYSKIKLRNIWPLQNMKLYYLFDFGDSWVFEIRKIQNKRYKEEKLSKTIKVIEKLGLNPIQYGHSEE